MAGCSTCSTSSGGTGGCQNNGSCGTSDCNKMNSFDWLSHMGIPQVDNFDIVEIKFKGGRKEYFRNVDYLALNTGDPVVVDVPSGHHIGYVSLQGELVRLQMQKRKVRDDDNITRIYRVANQKDMEKWEEARNREIPTLYRCRQIVEEFKLQMKMSDVEYQADNSKATFYYSAEDRVDFRELIKSLAGEFKIRVEMRQISLRQEAGRLGGVGVCGRELCCSTWLVDFKNVTTSAARYQNLSLNPGKLSGQCGRLKCCLNYELDTYMDAIKDIPQVEKPLLTESGPAKLQKTDIFRKLMWFSYNNDNDWHNITCERVKEIQELNEQGIKVFNLKVDNSSDVVDLAAQSTRELELLDKKFTKKKKKKPRNKGRLEGQPNGDISKTTQAVIPNSQKSQATQSSGKGTSPLGNAQKQKTPETQAVPRAESKEGNEARKKRNKNRNKPKPNSNQETSQKPQNQINKPIENKTEGNRKFPPRRNQGPNNGGNE
ncbi:Cell fate regulator YaaT, PSP1 superfamily (controls sporulation, competence, biofilm development) [Algoriphagus alkaliphilus]|uniref:Cell fate regulator YaaT, PSP1 superfamily (Controls sporulation, competence, biofilm development) n=2 Tax=Algoriphagus alkaliphilus TaxID=279824 RepID=A0A1G5V9W7_9BACT|nr:Cell fate regulator YaaT, PSP1 superfamily (controls sporulation, competence, biofilm development) [Algoriphagus alkaliphilus]